MKSRALAVALFLFAGAAAATDFYASPSGCATCSGAIGSPWTLAQALLGGYPTSSVKPGDTIWLRGGTYTGRYVTQLAGTAGNPITFRGYPGERATIDGNAAAPHNTPVFKLHAAENSGFVILRDLEITDSSTIRQSTGYDYVGGDGIYNIMPHSKIINCVIHDTAQGIGSYQSASGAEFYGNLIYHCGFWSYVTEASNEIAVIDLAPSGDSAVATSGSTSHGFGNSSTTPPYVATFSHAHTGDYLVVAANGMSGLAYTTLSATYGGVPMTPLQGVANTNGGGAVVLFGLAVGAKTANVVVTQSGATAGIRCTAQSFANVGSAAAAGSAKLVNGFDMTPLQVAVTSAMNHMVVEATFLGWGVLSNYRTTGAARTFTDDYSGTGSQHLEMTGAAGAASLTMGWAWDFQIDGFGHAAYLQEGETSDLVQVTAGSKTITITSGYAWAADRVGAFIWLGGAGPGGTDLSTTIQKFNSTYSVDVATTPSTSVANASATWGRGKIVKDNIFYDGIGANTLQIYGSSNAGFVNSTVEGNLCINRPMIVGGLTNFLTNASVVQRNYLWNTKAWPGYHQAHAVAFSFINNYVQGVIEAPASTAAKAEITMTGNTFVGTLSGFTQADFPSNTYYTGTSTPTTNLVVVRPNAYEANRANVYVYNWQNLTDVAVDLSSAVANGTALNIQNAQDFYAAPVWSGTYNGGTVSLPMTGLTAAAGIGYTAQGPTGQTFNAFIVVPGPASPTSTPRPKPLPSTPTTDAP